MIVRRPVIIPKRVNPEVRCRAARSRESDLPALPSDLRFTDVADSCCIKQDQSTCCRWAGGSSCSHSGIDLWFEYYAVGAALCALFTGRIP
jgi:hypothetical protein